MKLRGTDLTWQEIDEEIIILDLRASAYLRLNGTGAELWRKLESGADRDQLVDELVRSYGIDTSAAERDVDAFVRHLRQAKLLDDQT